MISALAYYLQTWCISNKGPVFAAMFSPLLLIVVGLFSAIGFAERIHLGRWAIRKVLSCICKLLPFSQIITIWLLLVSTNVTHFSLYLLGDEHFGEFSSGLII